MIFLAIWLLCGFLGSVIGAGKNRKGLGLALGLVLGVIGLIVIVMIEELPEGEPDRAIGKVIWLGVLLIGVPLVIAFFAIQSMRQDAEADRAAREQAEKMRVQSELQAEGQKQQAHARDAQQQAQLERAEYLRLHPTPYPVYVAPHPAPRSAEQERAEILRKYGAAK